MAAWGSPTAIDPAGPSSYLLGPVFPKKQPRAKSPWAKERGVSCTTEIAVPLLDVNRQNGPLWDEIEAAIRAVCDSGRFVHGPDCQQFEAALATYCGTGHAVGCASGSDALLLALMVLGVGQGDEVILPSFTFFATAGAVRRLGARPIFVDIEPDTFNIDPEKIEQVITPATRAIIPVHLFGCCANMTAINQIAVGHDLAVIEDAAQSIGATQQGRRAGSLGTLGCFSFYPTKNLGAFGDAGMITTDDARFAEKLRVLRDHGQQPQYHHHLIGVNSRLDTIQAALLRVKLAHLDGWNKQRQANACLYAELFSTAGLDEAIQLPKPPADSQQVWNQYTIRVPDGQRDALKNYLAERNIGTAVYYPVPLHRQQCFAKLGYGEGSLPQTEAAAGEVLSLPIFAELTDAEQQTVVAGIRGFYASRATQAA